MEIKGGKMNIKGSRRKTETISSMVLSSHYCNTVLAI